MPSKNYSTGYVYFVGCDEVPLVKIGWTDRRDVLGRVEELQTGSPVKLKLLGCRWARRHEESDLHRHYGEWRRHGEWFDASAPGLAAEIDRAVPSIDVDELLAGEQRNNPLSSLLGTYYDLSESFR